MVSAITIEGRTLRGVFQERPNRFVALVNSGDNVLPCFLPNPGRLHELLVPGREVLLHEASNENRKTEFDLIGVVHHGQMVSVDSRVPNRLVLEALRAGDIEELSEYDSIQSEVGYGRSRFDFFLANELTRCFLEVKSCTLVRDAVALFPDAQTERGRRHVRELVKAKHEGYRACVLFIVQRADADMFAPNHESDPEFGRVLRDAASEGVEVYAYTSEFSGDQITLKGRVTCHLDAHPHRP